jgi:hypothetical protein
MHGSGIIAKGSFRARDSTYCAIRAQSFEDVGGPLLVTPHRRRGLHPLFGSEVNGTAEHFRKLMLKPKVFPAVYYSREEPDKHINVGIIRYELVGARGGT